MARVTYGGGVSAFKGSIGGVTFQGNPSGQIVKRKTYYPCNPSPEQSANQGEVARLVALWHTLSSAQIAAWDAIATANDHTNPWGEVRTISGYQWFMSCNLNLIASGQSTITTAPAYSIPTVPDQFDLKANATELYLAWSPAWTPASAYNILQVSPPMRQGNLKIRRSMWNLNIYGSGTYTDWDITTLWNNRFNTTWADFWADSSAFIIVRVRTIGAATGYSSAWVADLVRIN